MNEGCKQVSLMSFFKDQKLKKLTFSRGLLTLTIKHIKGIFSSTHFQLRQLCFHKCFLTSLLSKLIFLSYLSLVLKSCGTGVALHSPSICMSSSDLTRLLASCSLSEPRLLQIESISSIKIVLGA